MAGVVLRRLAPLALLLGSCAREDWRNADLQLDLRAALPGEASRVRVCVEGWGFRELGAGPSRYAVPGLPAGEEARVTVDVLAGGEGGTGDTAGAGGAAIARAGPVTLDAETPYVEGELDTGYEGTACTAEGGAGGASGQDWLLAVRFEGSEP